MYRYGYSYCVLVSDRKSSPWSFVMTLAYLFAGKFSLPINLYTTILLLITKPIVLRYTCIITKGVYLRILKGLMTK